MGSSFLTSDNLTPEPAKDKRPIPYNDPYEGVQSGATMRNRYESGEWLPQASVDEEAAARKQKPSDKASKLER